MKKEFWTWIIWGDGNLSQLGTPSQDWYDRTCLGTEDFFFWGIWSLIHFSLRWFIYLLSSCVYFCVPSTPLKGIIVPGKAVLS